MRLQLVRPLDIAFLAEPEKRRAVAAEARGDAGGGHGLDEPEGEVGVAARGGETDEGSVGGLVRRDVVGRHPAEDVEGAVGARRGGGRVGAEVEEDVVVVEGKRGGVGEGGVVEVEGRGDVGLLRACVEVAAEEVFGGVAAAGLFGEFGGGDGGSGSGGGGVGCGGEVFEVMPKRRDGDLVVRAMGGEG